VTVLAAPSPGGPVLARTVDDPRVRRACNWVAAGLALYWVVDRLWPAPAGVLIKGAVIGGLYSLIALGIALVYRANRIINFAQGDMGGVPASLAVLLIAVSHWSYFAAIPVGLLSGVVLGVLIEFVVIRRFAKAPRMVLTVATIAVAQILIIGEIGMPKAFGRQLPPQIFPSPFNVSFGIGPVRFQGNDVLAMAVIPLVIAGLTWFLNRTHIGVAVRACAESADRASLLGVPVKRVNLVVWAVAALLATVGVILRAGVVGLPIGTALGLSVLLRTLTAAVIGRMEKMPTIVGASILLGVIEQAAVWHTGNSDVVDLVLFVVILVGLLVQRRQLATRAQEAALSTWIAMREVRPVPPELARLPGVTWARRGVLAAVAGMVLVIPYLLGEAKTELGSFLAAYLIIALSLLVLTGWTNQISLGHFAFVAVGSVTGAWMTLHWRVDLVAQMALAGLLGAVVAVAIGIPALRIRGLFLAVATLAFTFAASSYFFNSDHFHWMPNQFQAIPRLPLFGRVSLDTTDRYYYFSYAVLLVCILAVTGMRRSRVGRILVATRENERGVQAYGVNVTRAKLLAFAVSGFLAAVAGVLIVNHDGYLYSGLADPQSSINVFIMVVIGGLGSMTGVFAGAIYLEGLSWFANSVPKGLENIFQVLGSGIGLLVILMFLPGGVGSAIYRGRDRLLRELASRRGIIVPSLVADMAMRDDEGADRVILDAAPAVAQAALESERVTV
jgi:branched-chain amino acid transport system permease protein